MRTAISPLLAMSIFSNSQVTGRVPLLLNPKPFWAAMAGFSTACFSDKEPAPVWKILLPLRTLLGTPPTREQEDALDDVRIRPWRRPSQETNSCGACCHQKRCRSDFRHYKLNREYLLSESHDHNHTDLQPCHRYSPLLPWRGSLSPSRKPLPANPWIYIHRTQKEKKMSSFIRRPCITKSIDTRHCSSIDLNSRTSQDPRQQLNPVQNKTSKGSKTSQLLTHHIPFHTLPHIPTQYQIRKRQASSCITKRAKLAR